MIDFFDKLALDAKSTIVSGYYQKIAPVKPMHLSLKTSITQCIRVPIISELKAASPSKGLIRKDFVAKETAIAMAKGGAIGISVLTEPKHFNGSLENLTEVRRAVNLPILMKDFVLSSAQLDAAARAGANVVLLIQTLFDRGYCESGVEEMIAEAHSKNLEVLLETHTQDEFNRAVGTEADLIGINNRNLGTLKIDLNTTRNILSQNSNKNKIIVSESGINSPADIRFLKDCGTRAFLIGSAVMQSDNVMEKVREFVNS